MPAETFPEAVGKVVRALRTIDGTELKVVCDPEKFPDGICGPGRFGS